MEKKKIVPETFTIGVEMECLTTDYNAEDIGEDVEGNLRFDMVDDGSLSGIGEGMEFRSSPMQYEELSDQVNYLCNTLANYSVETNKTCGLHVHMSNEKFFNEKYIKRLVYVWVAIEDVLLATQPQSRFNNSYCKRYLLQFLHDSKSERKFPKGKDALIDELERNDRYYSLNLSALEKHGTIECRLHAGTINAEKIIQWVTLLQAIYSYALTEAYDKKTIDRLFKMPISSEKVEAVFTMLGLSEATATFYRARIDKFMFAILQKQQETASQLLGMEVAIKKAQKTYFKARDKARSIESSYSESLRTISASD